MADVEIERDLRRIRRNLAAQDIEGNVEVKISEKRQWWRADGTPLPNLLPDDDYHRTRFADKGWTLYDPGLLKDPDAVASPCPIELEVMKSQASAKAKEERLTLEKFGPTPFLSADNSDTTDPETETVEENENG